MTKIIKSISYSIYIKTTLIINLLIIDKRHTYFITPCIIKPILLIIIIKISIGKTDSFKTRKRGDQKVNVEEWRSSEIKVCNSYRIKKHLENNDNEKTHAPTFSSIEWHT